MRGSEKASGTVVTRFCALTNGWSLDIQRWVIHGGENSLSKDTEAGNHECIWEQQVAWLSN